MILGLKRGIVELVDHDTEWEVIATDTIQRLWNILGSTAKDIQHVGSTAIQHIKAKPIIDIAVAVDDFKKVEALMPILIKDGWSKSALHAVEGDILIVDDDELADTRTHHQQYEKSHSHLVSKRCFCAIYRWLTEPKDSTDYMNFMQMPIEKLGHRGFGKICFAGGVRKLPQTHPLNLRYLCIS